MDNDTDWAAAGLFSPSKARLAQVQAKDWAFIDAWLVKKYSHGRVPSFERNEDTLQVLLALIACNESADDQRNATRRVQQVALQHLTKQHNGPGQQLSQSIVTALGQEASADLQTLSEIAVSIDTPLKHGIAPVLARVVQLQNQAFDAKRQETGLKHQVETLQAEHQRLAALIKDLKSEQYQPSAETAEHTTNWTRGSKQFRAKIAEYDERIAASRPSRQMLALLEDISTTSSSIRSNQEKLATLKVQIEALQHLGEPGHDGGMVLARAEARLTELQTERDRLAKASQAAS